MAKAVELVWPPRCNLDVVTGSVWRLTHETTTPMTSECSMADETTPGVMQGSVRGASRPASGWKGLFYGETVLDGSWRVRWIRSEEEFKRIKAKPQRCKKCDAPIVPADARHPTDECPHFRKSRERKGEEASRESSRLDEVSRQAFRRRSVLASVRPQPGDGSCFFHSVGHHLRMTGPEVRRHVVSWMRDHLSLRVHGVPLSEWLAWEGTTAEDYLLHMTRSGVWGGGTEMAVLCNMYPDLSFHVFRRSGDGLFDQVTQIGSGRKEVWLCWSGGHYDALEPLQGKG